MSQVWAMKLAESKNLCYISDGVACTIKMNIKKYLHGKRWFPANAYLLKRLENLLKNLLANFVFSEGKIDSCYSVPTLGNPWTYVKQG